MCNEGDLHQRDGDWGWRGDAVDLAFLSVAHKLGLICEAALATHPLVNQIPLEPERQFAASYHRRAGGGTLVTVKGAPERVLEMCELPARVKRTAVFARVAPH